MFKMCFGEETEIWRDRSLWFRGGLKEKGYLRFICFLFEGESKKKRGHAIAKGGCEKKGEKLHWKEVGFRKEVCFRMIGAIK